MLFIKCYWYARTFIVSLIDGRKVYLFCFSSMYAIYYAHTKYPTIFNFSNKELLYLFLIFVFLMLNRSTQSKIHGHKLVRS